ncbi:uncharacterized protein LOC128864182 [Anastrepha ludens]|uniref:uncharacterized protein LOC128864182 n=1 Tax=Anastrepha ludens TaxID=28586 RepID=UPI0023B100A5|nr:uncharacterized protein LOC128864182 [Anastrepha ludens]
MDNKQLPTSSGNGQTLCANCFLFESCSCLHEQNKAMFMAWMKRQREESKQGNTELDKKVSEISIIIKEWEEYQQKTAELKQNIIDLNKKLSEMSIINKECKQNNAALEKQLNGLSKMLLKLENKDRRRKQQRRFQQRRFQHRHSQLQLAVNAAGAKKPRNANCTTTMNNQPSAPHATTEEESAAFEEEPHEKVLDEDIINDIIFAVTTRSGVSEEEVRNTIAAVCAEQRKLWEEENKGNMD